MTFRAAHAWVLCLLSTLGSSAHGARVDYTIGLGVEHNDNINLSENAPAGDTIIEPTLAFAVTESGSTIQANASGILQYRDFLQGRFGDDFLGQLNARLNWSAIPGWLDFGVEDYLGVQPINNLTPDTPGNQQQTNVFAAGPTLNIRLGPTVRGQAQLLYTNSYADETKQFNSDRASVALRAIKDLDSGTTLAANVLGERISFRDSQAAADYNRYSAFGRYTRKWARFDLVADAGYSWIKYGTSNVTGATDRDAALARANLDWHVTDRSTFTVDLAHQLSDAASGLLLTTASVPDTVNPIPAQLSTGSATTTSAAYLENRIDVGYSYRGVRGLFMVAPYYRKLDYGSLSVVAPADSSVGGAAISQTAHGATASAAWLLRPLLTIGVIASGENLRYDQLSRSDKTWNLQAFLRQQFTRHWSWRGSLTRYERDSTVAGQSADQNIVFVELTYSR
ncbi:MAG: outer membrane beta-barrel protein [Dokdonella sp.]|uniref:outer membrane beta-barrel protein n=1 Tax=Dokdonella sp. TaxID=2291710 RepID=UPI0032675B73